MKISPEVLQVFGEAGKTVQDALQERRLTAVSVENRSGQKYVQVIAPWPIDYTALNEAQNVLRTEHHLPVYLEPINPDHPIARYPIEVATSSAFFMLIVRTLRKYRLYRPRFGGPTDGLTVTVTVGEPLDWGRINAAQNELRDYATFEIFVEPRDPSALD
jgi:hypothetical protein